MQVKGITGAVLLTALSVISAQAADYPQAEISNGKIKAVLYLPDAKTGFYRGQRFDWSGVVKSLEFAGHSFYGPWFSDMDPAERDFRYNDKNEIIASSASADSGPVEEFRGTIGFDTAKPGDPFIKIGVGVFRRPDDAAYSNYRLYELIDGGKRTVEKTPTSVTFTQTLDVPSMGYGYVYTKKISLVGNTSQMTIEHTLKNTGKNPITSSVYDHNFLVLDGIPTGPGVSVHVPYQIAAAPAGGRGGRGASGGGRANAGGGNAGGANAAAAPAAPPVPYTETSGNQVRYLKKLENQERASATLGGFGTSSSDYDFRIENTAAGAGVHLTGDRPLTGASLWSVRTVMAVEPTIAVAADPGKDFTWKYTYEYYTLDKK